MRVLLDTDVVLNVIAERVPFAPAPPDQGGAGATIVELKQ